MATKKAVATRPGRTDLATLDAQLAQEAAHAISKAIAKPSGRRIMVKNKSFVLPDGTILGDSIDVIVVDFISANRYYPEQFSPNDLKPPVCFAFGKDIDTMAPMEESPEKQADECKSCPMNQWESDPKGGKGKACKNTRDLCVMLASDTEDPEAPLYTISVSPTGIKSFDGMVAYVFRTLNGPMIKAIINVSCNPNTEYVSLVFSDSVINEHYADHFARRAEAQDILFVTPDLSNYVPTGTASKKAAPARGRAAPTRPAARGTR